MMTSDCLPHQGLSSEEQLQINSRIHAAGTVLKGASLVKFVLGRRKQHSRFFKVDGTGKSARLQWGDGGHRGRLLKAQAAPPAGLQREQRLSDDELARCFSVVLEGKVLALWMGP
jgi:hypothetical protein